MIAQGIHVAKTLTFYAIAFLSLVDCFKLINIIYWIKKKDSTYVKLDAMAGHFPHNIFVPQNNLAK